MSNFDWTSFTNLSHLDKRIQAHLFRVYSTLSLTTLCMAAGAYLQVQHGNIGGFFSQLAAFAAIIGLGFMHPTKENLNKRKALLGAFGFCQGLAIGPLLSLALFVNSSLIFTAAAGACAIFVSFSASALLSQRRSYLFLSGILGSAMTCLCVLRLGSFFFGRSAGLYDAELYGGLLIFAGYVLFDTQMIIENAGAGDFDEVKHALDLFVNLLQIFVRILIILIKNTQKNEETKKKEKSKKRN